MASFFYMLYDAGFYIVEGFSLVGTAISVPLGTYVRAYFPNYYDSVYSLFELVGDVPIISDLLAFFFGTPNVLNANWIQIACFNVFGLLIYRVIKWLLDIVF